MIRTLQFKIMKKNILFLFSLLAVLLTNCTKLEENPIGTFSPEGFFKTPEDVEIGITGCYGLLTEEKFWGRKLPTTLMLLGDMTSIGNQSTHARRVELNSFNFDANNEMISAFWPMSYKIIAAANNTIYGAQNIAADSEIKLELEAEGRFIRALVYYHLVRLFGDIPYIDEMTPANSLETISKTDEDIVYQEIIDDLEFAKQYLPTQHPNNIRSRASKGSAYTVLASVYLTRENWQEAYNNAKWVIDNQVELNYDLVSDFQDLWNASLQDGMIETIFSLDYLGLFFYRNQNDDFHGAMTGIRNADKNGWGVCVPSLAVYQSFDDRDYRKKVTFEDSTLINGSLVHYTDYPKEKRPHCAKYFRFYGNALNEGRKTDNNYALFRYAEVLFIAAEALNELDGPTSEAISYINQIRNRARNGGTFPEDISAAEASDKNTFRKCILEERRIELAFEYKRWYDIKRRDLGPEVFGSQSLEPQPNFNPSKHYFLPLPQDELDRNENLLPQNTGYE